MDLLPGLLQKRANREAIKVLNLSYNNLLVKDLCHVKNCVMMICPQVCGKRERRGGASKYRFVQQRHPASFFAGE